MSSGVISPILAGWGDITPFFMAEIADQTCGSPLA